MFKIDDTLHYEAILHPDGTRAFFLVTSGFGMPTKTVRLAEKVVEMLNSLPQEELDKIYGGNCGRIPQPVPKTGVS